MRLALSLLLLSAAAFAQDAAKDAPKPEDPLKPSGPVTVTADRAEWQEGGVMRYGGNVALVSDTLKLAGDSMVLHQYPDGEYDARVTGTPALLSHAGAADKDGKPTPPVSAQAKNLVYDTRTGVVDIIGNAKMTRGADEITGDEIHYNARERRIQAAGVGGGQVKIVIQPPPKGEDKNKKP